MYLLCVLCLSVYVCVSGFVGDCVMVLHAALGVLCCAMLCCHRGSGDGERGDPHPHALQAHQTDTDPSAATETHRVHPPRAITRVSARLQF